MHRLSRMIMNWPLLTVLCALAAPALLAQTSIPKNPASPSAGPITVRTVKVLGSKDAVEIEVEASDRIVPQTKVLTGPDRLVVDFPDAIPGNQLRSQSVGQGEVKGLRVALLKSQPPVTRIVLDLKTAQSYQIFPYGRTVIIKVMGGGAEGSAGIRSARIGNSVSTPAKQPGLVPASYTARPQPANADTSDQPQLDVTFSNGLLGIRADKATLAEVLYAVQQHTGAEIRIAAGAEQEKIVADIAPAPAPEVLARLLNGSSFNFIILSAANDPQRLERVILSPRLQSAFVPEPTPAPVQDRVQDDDPEETEPASANLQPGSRVPTPPAQVPAQPDGKNPANDNTPDQ
jgi:antitoxin (DNA-binding transcriptional repressor) of toxin-antitoxin stability system